MITLVTGGSRGLGKSMVMALANKGQDIILTYNSKKKEAEDVAAEVRKLGVKAAVLQLDVSKSDTFSSFKDAVAKILKSDFGAERFDCLVNNAGIGVNAPFEQTTEEQFDLLVDIHLKAPFFITQKLLPLMNDGGRVINVSSGLTRFCLPGFAAYATMKGGIEVLTRYMAYELGGRRISAVVLAPGAIETDFGGGAVRDNKQANAFVAEHTALGRAGLPDDIGAAVSFLASADAAWINGQRIEASGGMFL